jgi:hypothetical protein
MSTENFDDDLIYAAFDDFTQAAAPSVKITGTAAVRTTVRRRRTVQATSLGLLSALLIAVPVVTYAVSSHPSNGPPLIAAGPSGLPSASPAVSASPVPSPSVSLAPSPSIAPSSPSTVSTTGAFTPAQLVAAQITVPPWHSIGSDSIGLGCDQIKAVRTSFGDQDAILVTSTVATNLDSDPAPETAALLRCAYGEASEWMVVGFDRNAAGKPVPLGVIAEGVVWSMKARAGGGITLDISDMQVCCGGPGIEEIHQTRSYAWTGSHVSQVGGPTSFYPHPHAAVLSITTTSHGWGPVVDHQRTGTITVTIKNTSSWTTGTIVVYNADAARLVYKTYYKSVPGIAPGASATVTLTLVVRTTEKASDARIWLYEVGTDTFGVLGQATSYPLWG